MHVAKRIEIMLALLVKAWETDVGAIPAESREILDEYLKNGTAPPEKPAPEKPAETGQRSFKKKTGYYSQRWTEPEGVLALMLNEQGYTTAAIARKLFEDGFTPHARNRKSVGVFVRSCSLVQKGKTYGGETPKARALRARIVRAFERQMARLEDGRKV